MTNAPDHPDSLVTDQGVDEDTPGPAAPDLVGPPATGLPEEGSAPPLDLGGTPATAPGQQLAAGEG